MGTPNNPISSGIAPPTVPGSPTLDSRSVGFGFKGLQPPSHIYVSGDELLILQCYNSVPGLTLLVEMRLLFPDGRLSRMEQRFPITSDRLNNTIEIQLYEGFLLSVTCAASPGPVKRGQFYVSCNLEYGRVGKGAFQYQLFAGYAGDAFVFGYPSNIPIQSVEGPGVPLSINNAAPGAGAEFVATVPVNTRWKLRSVGVNLTTSAVVANRLVEIVITDAGGAAIHRSIAGAVQAASLAVRYTESAQPYAPATDASQVSMPLPLDAVLFAGWQIKSQTTALQAADQYGPQQLWVEEWLEP